MINKIIDKMVAEKLDYKEYEEWAEEIEDEEIKGMLDTIAKQECDHYKMLKEWLKRYVNIDEM